MYQKKPKWHYINTRLRNVSSVSGPADDGDSGGGAVQLQMDFVEMLRVRDERRRMRHVETLRKNKEEEEGGSLDAEPHVELLGEKEDEELTKKIQHLVETFMSPEPPTNSRDTETQEKVGKH